LNLAKIRQHQYFKHLRQLHIRGENWEVEKIIPLTLLCAVQIEGVHLVTRSSCSRHQFESSLDLVMDQNPLKELYSFCTFEPIVTSVEFLRRLIVHCQALKHLRINLCEVDNSHDEVKKFLDEVKHTKLNIYQSDEDFFAEMIGLEYYMD